MNTLQHLIDDLTPTPRMKPLWQLLLAWGFVPLLLAVGIFWLRPLRADMPLKLEEMMFLTENVLMLLAGIFAAYTALWLSIPALQAPRRVVAMGGGALATWVGLLVYSGIHINPQDFIQHLQAELMDPHGCLSCVLFLSLLPAAALAFLCKKSAPLRPMLTGFFILLASGSFLAVVMRFTCAIDSFPHLFFAHFLPVMVLGLLGLLVGKFFLKF